MIPYACVLMQSWPWDTFGDKSHEKNHVDDVLVLFSSFSAQQLTSLTIIQQLKLLGQKHKLWAVVCNSWFHHHCQSQPDILANKPATEPSCLLHWLTGFNNRKSTRQHIKSADVYAHKAWEIKSAYHCTYRQISI